MIAFLRRIAWRLRAGSAPGAARATTGEPWRLPSSLEGRREAARWAYRTILLREPESAAPLDHLATHADSAQALRDTVLQSEEARNQPGFPLHLSMTGNEPPQAVQVRVTPEEERKLFARVQSVWHALGKSKPHWSVVTSESFRPQNIEASLEQFYATGEANVATLLRTLERNGIDAARLKRCMDFGCGVGRLTAALARHFEQMFAVDVSASHLAIAREALEKRGIRNVIPQLLETVEGIDALPKVDLIFSVIVLQHNPPPVIRSLFARLLGRLDAGGVAVIQVPTYLPAGYRFQAAEYAARGVDIEMHALPQREVFALARSAGVEVLEVLEDNWTGYGVGSRSNTFVLQRPG